MKHAVEHSLVTFATDLFKEINLVKAPECYCRVYLGQTNSDSHSCLRKERSGVGRRKATVEALSPRTVRPKMLFYCSPNKGTLIHGEAKSVSLLAFQTLLDLLAKKFLVNLHFTLHLPKEMEFGAVKLIIITL